jgi:hypothetical protein
MADLEGRLVKINVKEVRKGGAKNNGNILIFNFRSEKCR